MSNLNNTLAPRNVLYNLGAFDSEVNETSTTVTIDRKTIYIDTKYLLDHLFMNDYWAAQDKYVFGINIAEIVSVDQYNPMNYKDYVDNGCFPTAAYDNNYVVLMSTSTSSLPDNYLFWGRVSKQICFRKKEITTLADMKAYLSSLGSISIQLQAENILYEEVILKDKPLNILDAQGSQFIRQEYEQGLNCIDNSLSNKLMNADFGSNGYPYTSSGRAADLTFYLVEPNTTYTISNSTADLTMLVWYDNSKTMISRNGISGTATFTTGGNWTYIRVSSINGSAINFSKTMLVKGKHAYPYQSRNNVRGFLKDEYNKQVNLLDYSPTSFVIEGSGSNIVAISRANIYLSVGAYTFTTGVSTYKNLVAHGTAACSIDTSIKSTALTFEVTAEGFFTVRIATGDASISREMPAMIYRGTDNLVHVPYLGGEVAHKGCKCIWATGASQDFVLNLENGLYIFYVGKTLNGTLRATAVSMYIFNNDGGGQTMIPITTSSGIYVKFYAVSYVQDGSNYKGARYETYSNTALTGFGNADVYSIYKVL